MPNKSLTQLFEHIHSAISNVICGVCKYLLYKMHEFEYNNVVFDSYQTASSLNQYIENDRKSNNTK